MSKFMCCFRGESSSKAPFGDNHYLNYAHRYNLDIGDDRPGFPRAAGTSSDDLLLLGVHTYPWQEIVEATGNFNQSHFVGAGSFGSVFRCDFPEKLLVRAAKTQSLKVPGGHLEFAAEIRSLYRAQHPNVIRLTGITFGPNRRVLVYEFMPNGSLDKFIGVTPGLSWKRRMDIALGVAQALAYLHTELRVLHLDVKVGNVLLDHDFTPKLTDFGLAREIAQDNNGEEKPTVMKPIKGTRGCIAPETEESGFVTTKSDVYSYGAFLLQLFTGRTAYDRNRPQATRRIADWLRAECPRQDDFAAVIDGNLGGVFPAEGLNILYQVAMLCTHPEKSSRQDMDSVRTMIRDAAIYQIQEPSPVIPHRRTI